MKEYKTLKQQIDYLVETKNVDKDSIDLKVFDEKTYLSIITPYTDLVAIGRTNDEIQSHVYKESTNFKEYISWGEVDKYLSIILHNVIGSFEKKLKLFLERTICLWMYESGDKSCCDDSGWKVYLSGKSYLNFVKLHEIETNVNEIRIVEDSKKNSRKTAIENIIKIYNGEIRSTELIKHYRKKGYLPFWIVIHELTINELIQIFSIMKYEDKKTFVSDILDVDIKRISFNDVKKFESKLSYVTDLRNKINHYEPIIPFIIRLKPDLYNILFSSIKMISNYYKRGSKIEITIKKPSIATDMNDYNKKSYGRILDVIKILEDL